MSAEPSSEGNIRKTLRRRAAIKGPPHGLSGEQAFKEMKQFTYGPDFLHPEFKKFVHEYDVRKTVTTNTGG